MGGPPQENASQGVTINKMKLLKTSHFSENTKKTIKSWWRWSKRDAYSTKYWEILQNRSIFSCYHKHLDHFVLQWKLFFRARHILIYNMLWQKCSAMLWFVFRLESSIDQLWLILLTKDFRNQAHQRKSPSTSTALWQMIKHSALFGFLFQKAFWGKMQINPCREKWLSSGMKVWWMPL